MSTVQHVLTLVNVPEIFDLEPRDVVSALGAGWLAVDVRLRGGYGPTNQKRLSAKHSGFWRDVLRPLFPSYEPASPTTWPTYAEAIFRLADAAGLQRWGHGWLEAQKPAQATAEGQAVVETIGRLKLKRWGVNAERGVWVLGGSAAASDCKTHNPQAILVLEAFLDVFALHETGCHLDYMGFPSPGFHYPGCPPIPWSHRFRWKGQLVDMVYQIGFDGRFGAKADCERGRRDWPEHAIREDWSALVGSGRWHDKDGDGLVDANEVVGSEDTIRRIIAIFKPRVLRHYVGNGAAPQLTQGNPFYRSLAAFIPTLRTVEMVKAQLSVAA